MLTKIMVWDGNRMFGVNFGKFGGLGFLVKFEQMKVLVEFWFWVGEGEDSTSQYYKDYNN